MSRLIWTAIRGAVAGLVATWVMDRVTTAMWDRESAEDKAREEAAWPNGKPSVPNLVDLGSRITGVHFSPRARPAVDEVTHYLLGVGPGVLYALLRHRVPVIGAGRGFVYGLVLFAVNDELLNTAMGLAGPPGAYPLAAHTRGLVGHVVLGVATDAALIGG
jgi:uncharacterized membrane protein YagU involved in acid resistance